MKLSVFLKDELSITPGAVKISVKSQREKYREKYEALTKDHEIKATSYNTSPGNRTIVHFKIPSSTVDKFFYDALIELIPDNKSKSFEDCDVRFFSNSPSFVYGGYGYIFYHMDSDTGAINPKGSKGMMIDIFRHKIPRDRLLMPPTEKKLGKEAVSEEPITRNPMLFAYPDSSIFYAIFYMLDQMDYNKIIHNHNHLTEMQLMASISTFDHLMVERRQMANRQKRDREKKLKEEKEAVVKKTMRKGSATGFRRAMQPKRITGSGLKKPATNANKTGGVNRIG